MSAFSTVWNVGLHWNTRIIGLNLFSSRGGTACRSTASSTTSPLLSSCHFCGRHETVLEEQYESIQYFQKTLARFALTFDNTNMKCLHRYHSRVYRDPSSSRLHSQHVIFKKIPTFQECCTTIAPRLCRNSENMFWQRFGKTISAVELCFMRNQGWIVL